MSFTKVAVICGLMAALISGCGIAAKPLAGTPNLFKYAGFRGIYDDQRIARAQCLEQDHVPYFEFVTKKKIHGVPQYLQAIQIKPAQTGATVIFYPEAEVAEGQQIMGQDEGAELIGSALLYPHDTSGVTLTKVENCIAQGVG